MNKIAFFTIILFYFLTSNAQITKGNWLVGGDANYTNTKIINKLNNETTGSGSSIRFFPNIGYFAYDKLAIGINGNFNYGKANGSPSNLGFGGGPFARYYFLESEKTFNLFGEANYNYFTSKTQGFERSYGNSYRFRAGPVVYFNSSVGLEMTLNYSSETFSDTRSNYFSVGFGFQIHLEK